MFNYIKNAVLIFIEIITTPATIKSLFITNATIGICLILTALIIGGSVAGAMFSIMLNLSIAVLVLAVSSLRAAPRITAEYIY